MQQFFNQKVKSSRLAPRSPSWDYVQAGLDRNLQTVQRYYKIRPFSVKSNHILVRLLNSLGVAHDQNLERFHDIVEAKSPYLGMTFKMTSSIHKGILHDGLFYGEGTQEVIFATSEYFNPYLVEKHWQDVSAVTVLDHPRSDLDMLLPTGRKSTNETGIAVIAVNVPMLAVQYRTFSKIQFERMQTGISPLTTAQFVHMYVLPNMVASHLDVALFNRAVNLTTGAPMGVSTSKHRFPLIDYTARVDKVYSDLTKFIHTNDRDFYTILESFPAVSVPSMLTVNRLPDQAPTRQVAWAEVLTRLKALDWLTKISPDHGVRYNRSELNYFVREFVRNVSDNTFGHMLDAGAYMDSVLTIREIAKRIESDKLLRI